MIIKKVCFTLFFTIVLSSSFLAQNVIDSACIHTKIYSLASTEMQGREAGTLGGDIAKNYILDFLKSVKADKNTYLQTVPLVQIYNGKCYFFNKKDTLKENIDFYIAQKKTAKLLPLELKNNKIILLEFSSNWKNNLNKFKGKWIQFSFSDKRDKRIEELIQQKEYFIQNGILGLIISIPIETQSTFFSESKKTYLSQDLSYENFPVILINNNRFEQFLKRNKKISFTHKNTQFVNGFNIYTIFPGIKSTGNKTVLSAHYDHLGSNQRGVYYGADDNASGTAALMCIAHQIKNLQNTPQQNEEDIVIAWWTAEEKGLLGSSYFTQNPPFDIQKINAVINVDMIGRYDTQYNPPNNYIYVIGSNFISNQLHLINEEVNNNGEKLILDYIYNLYDHPEDLFQRSDQYNFHLQGIPSIFFFSGFHSDYHTIYDTPDKIDAKKASKIASHIYNLTLNLSKTKNQIVR